VREKLHYANTFNLIDLVKSFKKLGIEDKELLKAIIENLSKRKLPWELENVVYHAWEVGTYEYSHAKDNKCYQAKKDPLT